MHTTTFYPFHRLLIMAFLCATVCASSAEPTGILMKDGKLLMAEVVSVSKDGAKLKIDGKEKSFPLDQLDARGVLECSKRAPNVFDAGWHADMGLYFLDHKLFNDSVPELESAIRIDSSRETDLAPKLELARKSAGKPAPAADPKDTKAAKAAKADEPKPETQKADEPVDISPGDLVAALKNGEDLAAKFGRHRDVKPRSPEEMKAFLDKRKKELEDVLGGSWRMIETTHFYCFANIKEDVHKRIAVEWNERTFYDRVSRLLEHKEGGKLWNNKCPIYYFDKFEQFQKFAAEIDHSPGAGNSGGYFSAEGREVHVCIPFDVAKAGGVPSAEHHARDTVVHEGTHAFLQLTGEDVPINRWLHEGLAQFMEFWVEKEGEQNGAYGKDRRERATFMARLVKMGDIPSWKEMKDRPGGGTDLVGYTFAWSKTEFLYRNFPHDSLPKMIHMIKAGKTEDEAMTSAFGPPDKLEAMYVKWLKEAAKNGFKFE